VTIFRPTKAVLLAAGFGTRLLPLTREVPKPLLPLWGRTLLDRALDVLAGFGVREVLINLHHGAGAIRAHLERNPRADLRLQLSIEPEILGTGGALVRARHFLPDAEPFWLFNADVAAALDPRPLLADFALHQPLATLWLVSRLGPRTVEMRDGQILNLTSPRAGQPDLFTFTGLHLLSKRILNFLPPQEVFASMTPTYTAAMARGEVVRGLPVAGAFWTDTGTPADYLSAHERTQQLHHLRLRGGGLFAPEMARCAPRAQAGLKGFVALAPGVAVPPDAHLHHCVVLPGARIAPGAVLEDAIVGPDTVVRGAVTGLVGRADRWLDTAEQRALRKLGFAPEQTTVATTGIRGSQRTFTRLRRGAQTALLMRYDPAREENTLFARHARFLKKIGVPVPAILLDQPTQNLCIVEDLGDINLLDLQRGLPRDRLIALYEAVLGVVIRFHREGSYAAPRARLRHMPDFGPELYRWERDYFAEHMLARRCHLPKPTITRIKQELARIVPHLERSPYVLLHRDLQASNVLWSTKTLHLIDFQGLRFGPVTYDLASLLCDPYADLPGDVQEQLLEFYARHCRFAADIGVFWWAAIQRLVQALGAFAKLSARPELEHFADHIPAALRQLQRALRHNQFSPTLQAWVTEEMGKHGR
jgi:NDP-sugar pyrophosphorylase family protein/tRNA A-37 threonylcarbamoyl transferase component Bud32